METIRLAIGLPIAAAFPLGIPKLGSTRATPLILCLSYTFVVIYPKLISWTSLAALIATPLTMLALQSLGRRKARPKQDSQAQDPLFARLITISTPIALLGVSVVVIHRGLPALSHFDDFLRDDRSIIVLSGYLGAAFAGDVVVSHSVGHLLADTKAKPAITEKLRNAGAHIGWIERSIFYPLFMGGAADAAAIAFAAKSMVRLPSLNKNDHKMAEYVLIGGLASTATALGFAIAIRLSIGLDPL